MKTAMSVRLDLPTAASHHAHECPVKADRATYLNGREN